MAEIIKHHKGCGTSNAALLTKGGLPDQGGHKTYTVLTMGTKRAIQCNDCGAWIIVDPADLGETLEANLTQA